MVTATRPRIETGRNTVYSSGGVVVSISPLAASAGARVLGGWRQRLRRGDSHRGRGGGDGSSGVRRGRRAFRDHAPRQDGPGSWNERQRKGSHGSEPRLLCQARSQAYAAARAAGRRDSGRNPGVGADKRAVRHATTGQADRAGHRVRGGRLRCQRATGRRVQSAQ